MTDHSLIGSKTFGEFSQVIKSYKSKSDEDQATGMIIELDEAIIDCTFMTVKEIENHLNGLSGFVSSNIKNQDDLYYSLSRIYNVRVVVGCVISPGFDGEGNVLGFIKNYSNFLRAMTFHDNALYDYDWQSLASL